jgi:NAD(P)H-hydrate repair Nnr-like enzyme with NAD(P)H-hydrate epimerase domain
MAKVHEVGAIRFSGSIMVLQVDGDEYHIDISECSKRLAHATQQQREHFEVSPAGYGIHWPDVDEDLAIDGLIGIKHPSPLAESTA